MSTGSGCGGGACTCGGVAQAGSMGTVAPVATINGIALHGVGQAPDETELRELAWAELLRQEAVREALLPRHRELQAPALSPADHQVIESMLEREVQVPHATGDECRRYYEARQDRYVEGRLVHVRHILFAVTNGVDVHALAARAEQALVELSRKDVDPGRFAALARELSNCPSGAEGGDLGWIGPHDCADELANELFPQKNPLGVSAFGPVWCTPATDSISLKCWGASRGASCYSMRYANVSQCSWRSSRVPRRCTSTSNCWQAKPSSRACHWKVRSRHWSNRRQGRTPADCRR
jgi:peptidyl-prolyl cis-trans isomerase C